MYVPRVRGSWPGCWLLWNGVIFENDDALEEIGKRPSRSQSCYPGTDNDGLFPDERGHRKPLPNFPGETIGIETPIIPQRKKAWTLYSAILGVSSATLKLGLAAENSAFSIYGWPVI